jgi:hypothetical protein
MARSPSTTRPAARAKERSKLTSRAVGREEAAPTRRTSRRRCPPTMNRPWATPISTPSGATDPVAAPRRGGGEAISHRPPGSASSRTSRPRRWLLQPRCSCDGQWRSREDSLVASHPLQRATSQSRRDSWGNAGPQALPQQGHTSSSTPPSSRFSRFSTWRMVTLRCIANHHCCPVGDLTGLAEAACIPAEHVRGLAHPAAIESMVGSAGPVWPLIGRLRPGPCARAAGRNHSSKGRSTLSITCTTPLETSAASGATI